MKKTTKKSTNQRKKKQFATVNYPVGDFLIQIKNAAMAKNSKVEVVCTKFIRDVAQLLKSEGILQEVEEKGTMLEVTLSYHKKTPVVMDIRLVSKPGLRIYEDVSALESKRGASFYIISTNVGIMTQKQAIKKNIGGEIVAEIW